jgi:adhesin/invasin
MVVNAGNGQSAVAGTSVSTPPSVKVTDANSNPVAGVQVTFAVTTGGGTVTGATATTNAQGLATVGSWTLGPIARDNTLLASAGSLTATITATGTAGVAASMVVEAGDGQSAIVGTAVATPPSVKVTDASSNPVAGVQVTFAVTSGGGSLTGATATTNAQGLATVGSWTLGPAVGENTLTASAGSLSAIVSATGTAATATSMVTEAGDGQSATAGSVVAVPPSVKVTDDSDNPVAGVQVTFVVASGGGTVDAGSTSGAPSVVVTTGADGIASLDAWTLGAAVGSNTLTATSEGLDGSPITFTATGTAGAAASVALEAGDGQSASAGTAVTTAPSVKVTDSYGNPVAGVDVTFTVTGGDGTVDSGSSTGATSVVVATGAGGIASVDAWTLGGVPGANELRATVGGLAGSPVIFTATGTAAPATALAVVTGDRQTAITGGAVATAPSVRIVDGGGNPVPSLGVLVTFEVTQGGGTVSDGLTTGTSVTVPTDADGIATLTSWTLGAGGTNTLSVSATGLTSVQFTATAGYGLVITRQPPDGNSGAKLNPGPKVQLVDAVGNPVAAEGVTIDATLVTVSGSGTLQGPAVQTNAAGNATFTNHQVDGSGQFRLSFEGLNAPTTTALSEVFTIVP